MTGAAKPGEGAGRDAERNVDTWHGHRGEPVARLVRIEDAAAIAAIFNQGIEDRTATFETDFRSAGDVSLWFDASHPIVVVEDRAGGSVVGFAATSTYRPRRAYSGSPSFRSTWPAAPAAMGWAGQRCWPWPTRRRQPASGSSSRA